MNTTLSLAILAAIAQLRVQGSPWGPIAAQFGYDEQTLRMMLHQQGDEFQLELAAAKQEMIDELFVDCVKKLREVMNGGSHSKESTSAAKALLRVCEQHHRQAQRTAPPSKGNPTPKPVAEPQREPAPLPRVQVPPTTATPLSTIEPPPPPPAHVIVQPARTANATPVPPPTAGTITPKTLVKRMFAKSLHARGTTNHNSG